MGVEHELHDLKNRRRFELGKGEAAWVCADSFYPNAIGQTRAAGEAALIERMVSAWQADNAEQGADADAYVRDWGSRVWRFAEDAGWQIEPWCDVGDEDGDERTYGPGEWPVVDSRYAKR